MNCPVLAYEDKTWWGAVVNQKASSKDIPLKFKYVFKHVVSQTKWDCEPNSSQL